MNTLTRYSGTRARWVLLVVAAAAIALMFTPTFAYLYAQWQTEEYSHGFLLPLVSGYLIWQRRHQLEATPFTGSWAGAGVVVFGIALYFLGSLASITTLDAYALVIVVAGGLLAVMGWQAFRIVLVPVLLLFLMNPIPAFFYNNLSSQLQLLSSKIGVLVIRLFGVSVFLEGNVIDLGSYKLQVAEACSGLRYLFPLVTLGVIVGYLFRARVWMRWIVVLSTIPITVLMNSFRIGVIGVLVDHFGIEQAEGFLHYFEGWVIFVVCFVLLFLECWLLARWSSDRRRFRDLFALESPAGRPAGVIAVPRRLAVSGLAALLLLLAAVYPARALPERTELRPARADFAEFPLAIDGWNGRRQRLEQVYLDTLKLDDYVLADFARAALAGGAAATPPVNLYVAYYASQRTGQSAHSPRSCLPGGGWEMHDFGPHAIRGLPGRAALRVNRVIIQQGNARQLVYYWFQERGRVITNEFLVKWYLFVDALLRNRTDGALARFVTPLAPNETEASADARLEGFAADVLPTLHRYLPD
jgi:exosortase D (VPLPA-CTERM-specific)